MSPPAGVVSPECSNNRDNKSRKKSRKSSSSIGEKRNDTVGFDDVKRIQNDQISHWKMPFLLLRTQDKYPNFL